MAALANPPKRLHIVLRCTICGPLGLLFIFTSFAYVSKYKNEAEWFTVARSAKRARMGEGVTLSRRWGAGVSTPSEKV